MNNSIQCNHIEPHKDLFIHVNYTSTNETGPTFKCCYVFILCITLATNLLVFSASFFIVLEKIISKITLFTDSVWPKRFMKKSIQKSVHFQNNSVQSVHFFGENPYKLYIFLKNSVQSACI